MGILVGIDEVGRGCWAGPLVAGAVILSKPINGLRDSKVLSKFRRGVLAEQILCQANCGLGWVTAKEVDELGLTKAIGLAMQRAIDEINLEFTDIVIDGNLNFLAHDKRSRTLIGGDALEPAISAASIIAKVARDKFMADLAKEYPGYGFESHVGYGTRQHIEALRNYGVTPHHRRSYKPIKSLL